MTTTIEIKDNTWEELNKRKKAGKSFDDVITELIEDKITNVKNMSPLNAQITIRSLGLFIGNYHKERYYYLIEAINIIWEDLGEDFIKKRFTELNIDFDKFLKEKNKFTELLEKSDFKDKKIDRDKIDSRIKNWEEKTGINLSKSQPELFKILITLISFSSIQRYTIPSDAIKFGEKIGGKK